MKNKKFEIPATVYDMISSTYSALLKAESCLDDKHIYKEHHEVYQTVMDLATIASNTFSVLVYQYTDGKNMDDFLEAFANDELVLIDDRVKILS